MIGDTGSTDGTQDFIHSFFAARNIPGELHSFPFHNFEQARNAALDCAYASPLAYDYLLFDDADMELVVEDRDFRSKLTAPSYTVLQRSGDQLLEHTPGSSQTPARAIAASPMNMLMSRVAEASSCRESGTRTMPAVRTASTNSSATSELLKEGLKKEPESTRYWFYLAQSYRDAGKTEKAAETYAKRAGDGRLGRGGVVCPPSTGTLPAQIG